MTGKARNWSAAGAARFAREARIATAGYLRAAPAARRWHRTKLLNAYGLYLQHTGSPEAALGLLLGGLGYRPPYPPGWDEITEMVLADEAGDLASASLYILTPQMCDVTVAAALTLTPEDIALLAEDDLPSSAGLVVLPQPLLVSAVTGDLGDDRAYRWRSPARIQPLSAGRHLRRTVPAVRMSLYHDAHGPVRPDTFTAYESAARAAGTPLPPLILDAMRSVPLGYHATPEQEEDLKRFTGTARKSGEATRELYASEGIDENRVTGEYTPGSQIDDADDLFMAKFLFAFWRLCEQRIAVTEAAEIPHSARVLADKAGVAPDVRVIRLRRPAQPGADGPAGGRDWQHQWVVRMHKVRQWYPSEQRHKVLYRGPYIKGPEGSPCSAGKPSTASSASRASKQDDDGRAVGGGSTGTAKAWQPTGDWLAATGGRFTASTPLARSAEQLCCWSRSPPAGFSQGPGTVSGNCRPFNRAREPVTLPCRQLICFLLCLPADSGRVWRP